ncbi:MAG: glutathione peroxidase [Rhizobacter sp.]|nr:glutathione peroxidase [Burkholderiales bacterium]
MTTAFDFTAKDITGTQQDLAQYKGKALLIVNTASKCGFTPQYEGLQKLYDQYHEKGLEVLGFPCNQFGQQEPGDAAEIASFCDLTYSVNFPMFAKVDVNGESTAPLFEHLKKAAPGLLGSEAVKWNFTKFLVSPDGTVQRFSPQDAPASLAKDIEKVLG